MAIQGLSNIRNALVSLNPKSVREASEQAVYLNLHAADADAYRRMEAYFLQRLQESRRRDSAMLLSHGTRPASSNAPQALDIYDTSVQAPPGSLIFRPESVERFVREVVERYPNESLSLSRYFLPFREPYIQRIVAQTCRENTLFSIATALPDVIPSFIELPWAVAEFASDSAYLTMNQVKMAFHIAGASDREVGYLEQKAEIAAVIGSAFGWRALAKQVVSKIPFGGGLVGKAAIAYAGTKVLGLSLDRYYGTGYTYSREERKHLYNDAFEQGKKIANRLISLARPEGHNRLKVEEKRAS